MRSRSSATASTRSAFTLFELIIVLAIAGMLAGIVAVGIGRAGERRAHRNAITTLAAQLELARIEAMQSGEPVEVAIDFTPRAIICEFNQSRTEIPASGVVIASVDGKSPDQAWQDGKRGPEFEPDGRTRSRIISFAADGGSDTLLPTIEFDPISGAIGLGRAKDAPPRDQGGADR